MMHGPAAEPRWRDLPPLNDALPIVSAVSVPVGVIFFFAALVMDEVFLRRRPMGNQDDLLIMVICLVGFGFELMALVCGLVWFFQAWRIIARDDEEFAPGLKTALLFVPGFNFYWIFVVIPGLSAAIQRELREFAPNRSHNAGWVPGLVGCVLLVIPYLQPIALMLANNSLRRLIRYHERLRDEDDGSEAGAPVRRSELI
jgi:hypothetical protein